MGMFGTGILDDIFTGGQGKANKYNQGLMQQMQALFGQAQGEIGSGAGIARGDLMRALQAWQEGAANAGAEVNRLGDAARADVTANQDKAFGDVKQGFMNSGLSGASAGAFAKRGIASDTSRALADIDAALAQMQANIEMQKTSGQAGTFGQMAQTQMGASQGIAGSMMNQGLNLSNFMAQGGQSLLSMGADIGMGFMGFSKMFGG